jgi:hypothetical protein
MEREKVVAVIPSEGEGSHKKCNVQLPLFSLERSFTSFQDDRTYGGVIHGVVAQMERNEMSRTGVMEYWSAGVLGMTTNPLLRHSITPTLH